MSLTSKNQLLIAFKKLVGKAHTNAQIGSANEPVGSNVQIDNSTIFAQQIPSSPSSSLYSITNNIVEKVQFDVVSIGSSQYTAVGNASSIAADGDGAPVNTFTNGIHAFALKLPTNYTTLSSNPKKGNSFYINEQSLTGSNGSLQIVPEKYGALYPATVSSSIGILAPFDEEDYLLDPYSGILFVQDINRVPTSVTAYLYIGDYLTERVSSSVGQFSTITASSISASSYDGIPSTTPGGNNASIQFNSGSTFSGSSNLIYNYTTNVLSGTTAQFTTITSSNITGSRIDVNQIYVSDIQADTITADATNLYNIPAAGTFNGAIQYKDGSTIFGADNLIYNSENNILSGGTAQFTTITSSNVTGTLAKFTTISASKAEVSGSLVINGVVNLAEFPDYAYVLYTASFDKIVVYPGLYVSGNLTGSGVGAFQTLSASTYQGLPSFVTTPGGTNTTVQFNSGSTFSGSTNLVWDYTTNTLSGTTAQFTTITGSDISGSTARFTTITSSTAYFSGNVGIGTSTPNSTLDVSGSGIIRNNLIISPTATSQPDSTKLLYIYENTANTRGMRFSNSNVSLDFVASSDGRSYVGTFTNNDLSLITNNNARLTINTDGNVGIGTANPNAKLDVNGNTIITGTLNVTSTTTLATVSGTVAQFTAVTASAFTGSGAGLTNIPNAGLVNSSLTVGSTNISLGSSATTIQGINVLTGSTVTGSTALFTTITASSISASSYIGIPSVIPGGNNTSVQFNSGSTFSGSSNLIYNYTTGVLSGTVAQFVTITASSDIVVNGVTVGEGAGNIVTNTVLGSAALRTNTTGIRNVAIGTSSLAANTIGSQNVAVGADTLRANISGSDNVAVGYFALTANLGTTTLGCYNVAVGSQTLRSNTSGSYNVAIGANDAAAPPPLGSNTTGNGNVAIGQMTLGNNVSGDFNVAVGREALKKNTASSNTAIGLQALLENTTGTQNCAVGAISLTNNSTGGSNSAFGRASLQANTNGSNNTAAGLQSLNANTTGSFNTALGSQAGLNLNTGSNNLFLGYQAGLGETNLSDTVIIRANAERIRIDSAGNVGIATTAPTQTLDVNGTMRLRVLVAGTNAGFGRSTINGDITALTSDQRLKKEISTITGSLDSINKLRGVTYKWDDTRFSKFVIEEIQRDKVQIGLIAQEVETVLPELVYNNGVEDLKAVRYAELVAVLIEGIKELSQEVNNLKTEIQTLKSGSI